MAAELESRRAQRSKAKIRLGISGISSSGKTMSALLIAYGLCGDWEKIVVIDADNSADLLEKLPTDYGEPEALFHVMKLNDDYSPEQYIRAIEKCEASGFEVCIVDGISQEWQHILDLVDKAGGRSTDWVHPSARHKEFVKKILTCKIHIITTVRRVTEWVYSANDKGKVVPEKVGTKEETRAGYEYELSINFAMDIHHKATAMKDRTKLFMVGEEPPVAFVPSIKTGQIIRDWCEKGIDINVERKKAIEATGTCDNGNELGVLYDSKDMFHTDKDFIEALKMRAIVCADNYKNGTEILNGWRGLPIVKEDQDVKKAFRRRGMEVAYLMDTVDSLKEFWDTLCGKLDEEPPMKFMKEDKGFVEAVKAAKDLIKNKPPVKVNPFEEEEQKATAPATKAAVVGDGTKENPKKKKYGRKKPTGL